MTSYGLIFKLLIGIWIAALFGAIESYVAWAFSISFLFLELMGAFAKDKAYLLEELQAKNEGREPDYGEERGESRAEEFRRKLEEGKRSLPPAVIAYTDNDGEHHKITINADGRVDVEGNPDPKIIEAARNIGQGIIIFGPDAIAAEFQKQVEEFYKEQKEHEDNNRED